MAFWATTVTSGHRFGWHRYQKNQRDVAYLSRPISAATAACARRNIEKSRRFYPKLHGTRSGDSGNQILRSWDLGPATQLELGCARDLQRCPTQSARDLVAPLGLFEFSSSSCAWKVLLEVVCELDFKRKLLNWI
ncbi:hypothetical protein ACE6H2_015857 [Prunus campanulata]